jgi:hypothetical protein
VSNNADSVFAGLFKHPLTRPLHDAVQSLLDLAPIAGRFHETDGHPANDRLHYHLLGQEVQRAQAQGCWPVLMEKFDCLNHQTNLVIVHLMNIIVGVGLLNNLYSTVLFLRMGGHFVRVVGASHRLARLPQYFAWDQGCAQDIADGEPFCQELASFMADNHEFGLGEMRGVNRAASGRRPCRQRASYAEDAAKCFGQVFNGRVWQRGRLSHNCKYKGCCRSRSDAEAKMVWALNFMLRAMPPIPQISKWTKLLPVLAFFMACDLGGHRGRRWPGEGQGRWRRGCARGNREGSRTEGESGRGEV